MRVYRLLAIIMFLLNKEKISAGELADEFEVSPRTIYRDIEAICQAGIPVISFQGVDGGFSIMENYKIDRNLFTPDEILSILAALEGLNSTMEDSDIKNITEKIKALYPEKDSFIDKNQLIMDLNPWGENKDIKEKLDSLKQAIKEKRLVKIDYLNSKREHSNREIEPLTLALKGTTWYLYAFCHLRNDYRIFRLSRMINIRILKEHYVSEHKSFREFESENHWEQKGQEVRLKLLFRPEALLAIQDFFSDNLIHETEDGSYLVEVNFPEDHWVYGFILSFGDSVEVLEPSHIKDIIKNTAAKVVEKYN